MSDKGQQVAIITGGSQGIGASLGTAYRRPGWSVAATARAMKPAEDPDALTVDGDLADPRHRRPHHQRSTRTLRPHRHAHQQRRVDISKPFTDYTAEDYALMAGVNLTGFFRLTQRAIAEMLPRCGGHVVNISATLAEVANSSVPSVLAALTKGGLAAATRSLAVENASRGIRVNAVSPGIIQTPVHPADSYKEPGDRLPPLGRAGQVSDVVDGILFLEASPYITGRSCTSTVARSPGTDRGPRRGSTRRRAAAGAGRIRLSRMLDERGVAWPDPADTTLAASEVPNALIWRCGTVIAVKPTSAQNAAMRAGVNQPGSRSVTVFRICASALGE
jgi:NAD(P)-dependent dehydrogenase (short-subunit alcohol dehydrogenase family)